MRLVVATVFLSSPVHGQTKDPRTANGETGKITFSYRGSAITLTTVRAADGNIWLQQNLGSKRPAQAQDDELSYGDLFQWGRWDDGHQVRNPEYTANKELSPNDPSGLKTAGRNPFLYNGLNAWWLQGTSIDEWTAAKPEEVTQTRGCDPCKALGAGWRLPTLAEWQTVIGKEEITNGSSALNSNLKLSLAGRRDAVNSIVQSEGTGGNYWAGNTPRKAGHGYFVYLTQLSTATNNLRTRGAGISVRCIKTNQ